MTAAQLALDLSPLTEPDYTPALTLDDRYALWTEANPHAVPAFEALAEEWLTARKRIGVKALAEILRHRTDFDTNGNGWKIDNSMLSRVARDLVRRRPDWDDRIERRALASERAH